MKNHKKIIAITLVALFAVTFGAGPVAYASEVTGTISSSASGGSQVSGTVGGSATGGSSISGTVGGGSGGGGGGAGGSALAGTVTGGGGSGGSGQQTSVPGSVLGASTIALAPGLPDAGFSTNQVSLLWVLLMGIFVSLSSIVIYKGIKNIN